MNLLFFNIGATEMAFIALPLLIAFVYTLYHAVTNKNLTTYERSLWILIIVLGNLLGLASVLGDWQEWRCEGKAEGECWVMN